MFKYFRDSFRRKIARRYTKEYPSLINHYQLEKDGQIDFAEWANPLATRLGLKQETVDFFRKFIKEGDLVIDIGANIGDTTVPMGLAAGKSGLALGFDPNPYVFKILKENATLNQNKLSIHALPFAISVEEEEFFFISSEASFVNGGISPTKESRHGKFVYPAKIKGIPLMRFLEANYGDWLPKLSFIKVDTEGYDKEILKSISDLIAQYKPVIVAESFEHNSPADKMELFETIAKHGYDIFYFEEFDTTAKVVSIPTKEDITKWHININIYALPR
ncbi:FkbM family methyltransferase [Runella sp. CRIBMP]|uniref:FkbM family methyltransferase n=1 Tax=Runella sp. CRIBMP TaxID=2683261 RepID=UPI001412A7A0|nr:FkbM family methyltransferase [Runella sp. CRIBMP]NBB20207.1 FkbM family methyltransferase [Runella sp. CRIBMP]